jgi:hypothetical protein
MIALHSERLIPVLCTVVLLLFVSPNSSPRPDADNENAKANSDCGARALYTLIRFEGKPITFSWLMGVLGRPTPDGYSMEDLRRAASICGVSLIGVQLPTTGGPPDRPALAYLRVGLHGHYLSLRPVGHTGSLVQVVDPNHNPYVLDASRLYSSTGWTGIVLIPERPNWMVRIACGAASISVSLLAVLGLRHVVSLVCTTKMARAAGGRFKASPRA